jgi:hypothetical protein
MTETPNLTLPYILAAQAQKHVTHNEAIRALDCLVQLSVLSRTVTEPPPSPAEGNRYIVASGASGAWEGQDGKVAAFQDGAWAFYAPKEGWIAWVESENILAVYEAGTWSAVPGGGGGVTAHGMLTGLDHDDHPQYHTDARGDARYTPNNPATLGINATADTTNRLAVASPASLFNHAGNGHQVKVNKNSSSDTASFLFQDNFSGRAEIGLAGDDDFHFKVSADGSAWNEAMVINRATAKVSFPATAFANVQRFTVSGTWTKPAGATAIYVLVTGAGGGGGGGGKSSSGAQVSGGGGGGGAARVERWLNAADVSSTVSVTVGAGGAGGAGATTSGNGGDGTAGGSSSFGSYVTAYGGGLGSGGSNSRGSGGGAGSTARSQNGCDASGATGGAGNGSAQYGSNGGSNGSNGVSTGLFTAGGGGGSCSATGSTVGMGGAAAYGAGGGAGGGGVTSANAAANGGDALNAVSTANSAGGTAPGGSGGSGPTETITQARGGAGGAGNTSGNGGNGGNGGAPGGGGGGGGGSQTGNGGAGGNGGRGEVLVVAF